MVDSIVFLYWYLIYMSALEQVIIVYKILDVKKFYRIENT